MKAVILAGGTGSRLMEETVSKPKPMIEVGGRPILWHIMKIYSAHGVHDFIICLGYRGYVIKEYFSNYFLHMSDVTFDMASNRMEVHNAKSEPWRVTLIDTGEQTMTGGRLKRILPLVAADPMFCMTYGDGVGNVDVTALVAFHAGAGRLATVTGTQPPARFGALSVAGDAVEAVQEKPPGGVDGGVDGGWINGGFFVLSPKVADWIDGDECVWERAPMERLAAAGQLGLFRHTGFWQPMDTLRDKTQLEAHWASGRAPWQVWPS
jgi:glucose-1-phosphate cytidylyltransferase